MSGRLSTITCCCGFNVPVRTDAHFCSRCGADLRPLQLLRAIPLRLHDEARGLNAAGKSYEARERLGAALALEPAFAQARVLLANSHLNNGDRARAAYEARVGLALNPGHEMLKQILAEAEDGGDPSGSRTRNFWTSAKKAE